MPTTFGRLSQSCCQSHAVALLLPLALLRFGFGLTFSHRIDASTQELLRSEVHFSGLVGRDKRVLSEGYVLFAAIELIAPEPELRAGR